MFSRTVLALPSLAVVGLYAAILLAPKLGLSVPASALLMCSLVWAFALYLFARRRSNSRAHFGSVIFWIAIALLVITEPLLPHTSEWEMGSPLHLLLLGSGAFVLVAIVLAASALLNAEGKNDFPWTISHAVTFFSIVFLPAGIWFLRPRIVQLLGQ